MKLNEDQMAGLAELDAVHRSGEEWARSYTLSGSDKVRSSINFRGLMKLGLVEGGKSNPYNRQGQWRYRITDAGRRALATKEEGDE